jgi:hypothetical protein
MGAWKLARQISLLVFLNVACRHHPAQKSWSFADSIGVAGVKAGKTCLSIARADLAIDTPVRLVLLSVPQATSDAVRLAPDGPCAPADGGLHAYAIRLEKLDPLPAIAVVNFRGAFAREGDLLVADLDNDGQPEYFRSCASTEGVHFTVWSGAPLKGRLRWHQYYYLGYDVEATCTPREVESPK